ncbi:MAG TPA: WHG domain-containing protein [Candidatus Binatia bacterium]|jgi:AcrR family transcriptional regulator|nr:WHG domain-containing protein [Candidatus Binatia bacterium]
MGVRRRWLTREIVVQTAMEMADEGGDANAVTLTDVARALGVRTPSLYNHVDGIDDLRQAMALFDANELCRSIEQATAGLLGREALLAVATVYRRFARCHPGVYALTIRAPEPDEAELTAAANRLLQVLLLLLASLGLEGNVALHTIRGLRSLLHGFVSLEAAEGFKMALDHDASYMRVVGIYLDGLGIR